MKDNKYLVALYTFVPFGPHRTELLLKYFSSAKKVWSADRSELLSTGLSHDIVDKFIEHRDKFEFETYFDKLDKLSIKVFLKGKTDYPKNLSNLSNAPVVLYCRGEIKKKDIDAVAIVGSRQMTSYGSEVAKIFATKLASLGVTIISGLALGIDAVAHKAALSAGGRTIAVVGCGIDIVYPASNISLAKSIIESNSGAILSEYPLGYPALPVNFVNRNRIVSGLSKAVVVVEGRRQSGTLLTAMHAVEQGREVFAVPGQITSPTSEAPFYLIENGAKMATKPEDIVRELDMQLLVDKDAYEKVLPSDELEVKIAKILELEPLHIDVIVRSAKSDTNTITSKLMMMELKGIVKHLGEGEYRLI